MGYMWLKVGQGSLIMVKIDTNVNAKSGKRADNCQKVFKMWSRWKNG